MNGDAPERFAEVVFTPGRVYMHRSRRKQLLRLICFDAVRDTLIFKLAQQKWDKFGKPAVELERKRARTLARKGKLLEESDYIRPSYLSLNDEQLKKESRKTNDDAMTWLKTRDEAYALIKDLVSHDDPLQDRSDLLVAAYSPLTCVAVVRAHAKKMGVKPIVIRRLLHKYAWFGLDKNALLHRDQFKGRTGAFVKEYAAKPGPHNAAVKLFGEKYRGRARTKKDVGVFLTALELFYTGRHMTLTETYEAMLEHFYFQANQSGLFPIRPDKIPTFRQFSNAAQELIVNFDLKARRAGHKDGRERQERRGYDVDIAAEVGDVFDIDGTPFNKELVSTYKVDGKAFNIGKATALVLFDRRSKKGVGWHVYVGTENWKEGYRLALFCALTSKKEHLKWLEIDDFNAWRDEENIIPSFVYVDGGPGASNKGQAALKRLSVDFFRAPPDTPYWKPTVEGGQRILQDAQAQDCGGYKRTNDAVDKEAKRKAKLYAKETVWQVERKLVLSLIKYNRRRCGDEKLTFEMKRDGVRPTPEAIFSWGVERMGGVQKRRLLDSDVYEALLDHEEHNVTVNGAALLGARYQSARLRAYRNSVGKNLKIQIMYHPLRAREVYWRTQDGVIDRLERDKQGNRNVGLGSVHDLTEYHRRMLASGIVEKYKSRSRNVLSRRQEEQLLRVAGAKPKRQRKTVSNNATVMRALEAGHHQATRPYDRPEKNAPHLVDTLSLAAQDAAPGGSSVPLPSALSSEGAPIPTSTLDITGKTKPAGRLHTADLFELRRQQASKKGPA